MDFLDTDIFWVKWKFSDNLDHGLKFYRRQMTFSTLSIPRAIIVQLLKNETKSELMT